MLCARGQQVVTQSWLCRLNKELQVRRRHRVQVLSRRLPNYDYSKLKGEEVIYKRSSLYKYSSSTALHRLH